MPPDLFLPRGFLSEVSPRIRAMNRNFIIGDIHGCIEEFNELLDILAPTSSDQVVLCGDLVDKGPHSLRS